MEDEVLESASVWARRIEKGSHEFVVENYSLRRKEIGVNKAIESDEFVMDGHRWTICFYPDGKEVDVHNDGYASLYISLKNVYISMKNEMVEPVQFLCEPYILDQSGKGNHCSISPFEGELSEGSMIGRLRCISRALLESPYSDYLKDDRLKIRVTLGVYDYESLNQPLLKVPESTIREDFGKLLESKLWADVFIRVADQSFCAHKLILTARCPALLSLLSNGDRPQDIVIPDMEPRIFKAMLWFIYTGTLQKEEQEDFSDFGPSVLKSFLAKILVAADQFELKILKEICESHISDKVSVKSVGYLLHLANACHATKLKSACLRFAAENEAAFMVSDGCEYLKETCPLLFLELAGFGHNPSIIVKGVLYLCNKVLVAFKKFLFGYSLKKHEEIIPSKNFC